MPTYEYRCEACGHTFEEFQSITAEPIKVCPGCKKAKVRRLIGIGSALLFKGSGFYQTDYRSPTYTSAAKSDSSSSASSSTSGSSGTSSSTGNSGSGTADKSTGSNGGSSTSSKSTKGKSK